MSSATVQTAWQAAISEAARFRGATTPNPPVGAAALDAQGRLLGVAAHERAGNAHAEAKLLAELRAQGRLAEIDTLLVTLEPCHHTGRTPPCTRAILEARKDAGLKRVIYGAADPNPRVVGGGGPALREAGVDATLAADPEVQKACEDLIAPFAWWSTTGLPYVTLKTAELDGGMARRGLEPRRDRMIPPPGIKTFTSDSSLRLAHELRKRADAILTGSGTVLADDPEFTVRRVPDHVSAPARKLVILDRRGRIPPEWLKKAAGRGFDVWIRDDVRRALRELGESGALEVLIEAGPALAGYFLSERLWNEHVLIRKSNLSSEMSGNGLPPCRSIEDTIDVYRNRPEDRPDHA